MFDKCLFAGLNTVAAFERKRVAGRCGHGFPNSGYSRSVPGVCQTGSTRQTERVSRVREAKVGVLQGW